MSATKQGTNDGPTRGSGRPANDDEFFNRMASYMDRKFEDTNEKISNITGTVTALSVSVTKNQQEIALVRKEMQGLDERIVATVKEQLANTPRGQSQQPDAVLRFEERINNMSKELDKVRAVGRAREMNRTQSASRPDESDENRAYWKARKSVRVWPVAGITKKQIWTNAGKFFADIMLVPQEEISVDKIEEIYRVHGNKRSKIKDEVVVVFSDITTRDNVASYATNFASVRTSPNSVGLRLEVPGHLTGVFRTLEQHGHSLRKLHGRDFNWHYKFSDIGQTLCMFIKLPSDDEWIRVTYEMARAEVDESVKATSQEHQKQIRSAGSARDDVFDPRDDDQEMHGDSRDDNPRPSGSTGQSADWGADK